MVQIHYSQCVDFSTIVDILRTSKITNSCDAVIVRYFYFVWKTKGRWFKSNHCSFCNVAQR